MPKRKVWPKEKKEQLTKLWNSGLSYNQVADELGVTRNVVAGMVFRLKLKRGTSTRHANGSGKRPFRYRARFGKHKAQTAPEKKERKHIEVLPANPGLMAVAFDGLTGRTCRWPLGEPGAPGFCYCGCPASKLPYCLPHKRLAHQGVFNPATDI